MRETVRLEGLGHVHAEQNAIIVDAAARVRNGLAGMGGIAPEYGSDPLFLDPDEVRTVAGGDR